MIRCKVTSALGWGGRPGMFACAIALCASSAFLAAAENQPEIATGDRGQQASIETPVEVSPAQSRVHSDSRVGKVCGEIHLHRTIKNSVRDEPPAVQREVFAAYGIEPADLDSELAALYVARKLTEQEVQEWHGLGVRVIERAYIPPVAGRHPHGFYPAVIEYAALDAIENDERIVRVTSMEGALEPQNDLGLEVINAAGLHDGLVLPPSIDLEPLLGAGIGVAVADSGVDLSHPDLPIPVEAFDVTTGPDASVWSTDVSNTVIWHGTHVAGTVLGSGAASGGTYAGAAPGADFHFYKIGNDSNGNASYLSMTLAVNRALEVGCRIFTMSYGGSDTFMDGSSSMSQTLDYAYEQGMICFISAGNKGGSQQHYSATVQPNSSSDSFELWVGNPSSSQPYTPTISLRVIWRDDVELEDNVNLIASELDEGEEFYEAFFSISDRGTKSRRFILKPILEPDEVKSYTFELVNSAPEGAPAPLVHIYQTSISYAIFPDDDPFYTVLHPAQADTAVAVGAWRHRADWTDYFGNDWGYSSGDDILAPFSSRGPRVDGQFKPEIVAPGSMTVSLRDSVYANSSSRIISNHGLNNGTGPAEYYIAQGTSMAAPLAAGAMALLLEHDPTLTAAEAIERFTSTASDAGAPNPSTGHGMIDVLAAVLADSTSPVAGDLNADGVVGVTDLLLLLGAWGPCDECAACEADLTDDCEVGVPDLLVLLANWG